MVVVALALDEPIIIAGFLSFSAGSILLWKLLSETGSSGEYSGGESLATAALAWALLALGSALPF